MLGHLFERAKNEQRKSRKQTVVSYLLALAVALGFGTLCGCAGVSAGGAPHSSNLISVAVYPADATVLSGGSLQFTATVTSASQSGVAWTSSAGTISSSGLLTAPSVASQTNVTVTANSVANPQMQAFAAVSVVPPLSISTTSLPPATPGIAYSTGLVAKGGESPFQWNVASGSLPTGLALDASTGVLSGITTATGTSTFVAQVDDSSGQTAQQTLTLTVGATPGAACGPPRYQCSRSDFEILIPTAPPQLGSDLNLYGGHSGAGTIATDPAYGNRILRVTDGNTDTSNPGMSYGTSWSSEANLISSDESFFFVTNEGSTPCLFQFDQAAFQATFRGCQYNSGGGNLQFGYTAQDASAFYNFSGPYLYRFLIDRSDFSISADPSFNNGKGRFNPDGPKCLGGELAASGQWYVQDTSLSSDDATFVAAIGPEQDVSPYVVVWNATKGCRWMNVSTWEVSSGWNAGPTNPARISWVSGTARTLPGGMHNVELDRSGQYAVLTINGAGGFPNKVFWDIDTNTVNDTCTQCWSHWACDFDVCFWSFGPSSQGFQMRDLAILPSTDMSSMMGNKDIPAIPSQPSSGMDEHAAHQNADSGQKNIYLVEESLDSGAFSVAGLWDNELIGVNWDGSKRVVRFNKTWSSGFAGCPISPLGHFAICGSDYQLYNMNLGFGNGLNQDTCDHNAQASGRGTTACRHDVLLFELR